MSTFGVEEEYFYSVEGAYLLWGWEYNHFGVGVHFSWGREWVSPSNSEVISSGIR